MTSFSDFFSVLQHVGGDLRFTTDKPPSDDEVRAAQRRLGTTVPSQYRELLDHYDGFILQAKENVWPRPRELDVGPAWTFQYGFAVFGIGKNVPESLHLSEVRSDFRDKTENDELVPFLRRMLSADYVCFDLKHQIVEWWHDDPDRLVKCEEDFLGVLIREILRLVKDKEKMKTRLLTEELKKKPGDFDLLLSSARTFHSAGMYLESMDLLGRCLKLKPGNAEALSLRGHANYCLKKFDQACSDFLSARNAGFQPEYSLLWAYAAAAHCPSAKKLEVVEKIRSVLPTIREKPWPSAAIRMFAGEVKEDQFLSDLQSCPPEEQRARKCEGNFFLGVRKALQNNGEAARNCFTQSAANAMPYFLEVALVETELELLSPSG